MEQNTIKCFEKVKKIPKYLRSLTKPSILGPIGSWSNYKVHRVLGVELSQRHKPSSNWLGFTTKGTVKCNANTSLFQNKRFTVLVYYLNGKGGVFVASYTVTVPKCIDVMEGEACTSSCYSKNVRASPRACHF